jgi:hypothetical protein
MGVAIASLIMIAAATFVALPLVVGSDLTQRHQDAIRCVCVSGGSIGCLVVGIQLLLPFLLGLPLTQWDTVVTNYYLATAQLIHVAPYPFNWNSGWIYLIGLLTPLIPLGGLLSIAASSALRSNSGVTSIGRSVGAIAVAAFLVGSVHAAVETWYGVRV